MLKDSVIFKGLPLSYVPVNIWATKIGVMVYFFLLFFEGEVTRVDRWTWDDWEVGKLGEHYVKFPNNSNIMLKIFWLVCFVCL